jgi:hypothetical protein
MPTKQETFDKVVNHLRQQNCKAQIEQDGHTKCAYHGQNGTMCAAGCLIPDDEYHYYFEGNSISFCSQLLYLIGNKLGHDIELVSSLQSVHDRYDVSDWENELKNVANRFKLIYTPKD